MWIILCNFFKILKLVSVPKASYYTALKSVVSSLVLVDQSLHPKLSIFPVSITHHNYISYTIWHLTNISYMLIYFSATNKVWASDRFQYFSNITGMHMFKDQFPNKGKNANYSQSSYYPINAPHFWVYDLQRAFTPQFTPLSKSASGPTVGSELKTAELESSPQKSLFDHFYPTVMF